MLRMMVSRGRLRMMLGMMMLRMMRCRKSARVQNLGAHFVRACAVKMHFNIPQEPLYTNIYRKKSTAQNLKLASLHSRNDVNISEEPLYTEFYR